VSYLFFIPEIRGGKKKTEKNGGVCGVGEGQQDAEQFVCGDLGDDIHD
jgi:hypothetical protein